jgi:hypothetical protein
MAYKTINGKLVKKFNYKTCIDPNVEALTAQIKALDPNSTLVVLHHNWKALPPAIKIDTDTHFAAHYVDNFGGYDFEIIKTHKGYTVISDGTLVSEDNPEREYIIWNYECQVKAYLPKVLA